MDFHAYCVPTAEVAPNGGRACPWVRPEIKESFISALAFSMHLMRAFCEAFSYSGRQAYYEAKLFCSSCSMVCTSPTGGFALMRRPQNPHAGLEVIVFRTE